MTRRAAGLVLASIAALAIAVACGDVPTHPLGIAYITPVLAPSPSVAYGDSLRDSLGRAAPLQVYALGQNPGDTIRGITVRYLFTTPRSGATIDANGFLVAPDSLQTLHLVAQVHDASGGTDLQIQTPEFSIDVVPRADTMTAAAAFDSSFALPFLAALPVTVSGQGPKTRGTVGGIIVRYQITQVYPAAAASRYYLATEGGITLRGDSTIAVDTTSSAGSAARSLAGTRAGAGQVDADSVVVLARARSHAGKELTPVRFLMKIKKS